MLRGEIVVSHIPDVDLPGIVGRTRSSADEVNRFVLALGAQHAQLISSPPATDDANRFVAELRQRRAQQSSEINLVFGLKGVSTDG